MLSEALTALARAEHLHRRFFSLSGPRHAVWEPPVDVFETETEVLVFAALPGVPPEETEVLLEEGEVVIRGRRPLPPEARNAVIHRMELPQGQFERRLPIPPGRYQLGRQERDGCIILRLTRIASGGTT